MSLFSKKETYNLSVGGMHCEKCVARVTEALQGVEGVTDVEVSLQGESATAEGRGIDPSQLVAAVRAVGFSAALP